MNNDIKTRILSGTEIIMKSLRLFWGNLKYILPICLAVYIPINILLCFIPTDLFVVLLEGINDLTASQASYYLRYVFIIMGIFIVFTPLLAGALSYVTIQIVENKAIKVAGILDSSLVRWGKLVYTMLLYAVIIMVTGPTIVLPIYFTLSFMLCSCIVSVSNKYGFSALLISRVLMRRNMLKGFVLFLLNLCVSEIIGRIFMFIIVAFNVPDNSISQFIISVISDTLGAFSYISICLFYINIHYTFDKKKNIANEYKQE